MCFGAPPLFCYAADTGFAYEQRYWKNRFDKDQLEVFLQALASVVRAFMTVEQTGEVRELLPQSLLPRESVYQGSLAKVVNDEGLVQPVGGWGHLLVLEGVEWNDTGSIARVLPNGSVDLLSDSGRTIMVEGLRGREFADLARLEERLLGCEGVDAADCYVAYSPNNTMQVYACVNGSDVWDYARIEGELDRQL